MKRDSMDICEGPILKNVILYTVPIIATGILQLLFNAADLVVVGRFSGHLSVAAVGATNTLINLLVNFFIGLSLGAGVITAHATGAKDDKRVHRIVHTAIPTALICGVLLTVIGIALCKPILQLMNTPDNVIDLSTLYLRIYFCGITATILYNFGAAILRAVGDTKRPLLYLTIAGVINLLLNLFFVIVLHLDVAGVALATAISQIVSAALVVYSLTKRTDACKLILRKMHIYKRQLIRILQAGIPAGIQSSLAAVANVMIQSSINTFGEVAVAGSAASASIEGFVFTALNSFNQTAMNFVGQNVGAAKYERIHKITFACVGYTTLVGVTFGSLACIFGKQLLGIYITDSPEAIQAGLIRLTYICLPYFLCGIMNVITGATRGLGYALAPMLISVGGICGLRVVWIYTLFQIPALHTLESIFISYSISWIITLLAELIAYLILSNKLKKKFLAAKQQSEAKAIV